MRTVPITRFRRAMNNFSKIGQHTNELVKELKADGYTNIYQRPLGKGKIGIIAKNGSQNYLAVQDINTNTMKQKKSQKSIVLTFFGGIDKYTEKIVGDLQGNIKSFVCKLNSHNVLTKTTKKFYQNGNVYQKVEDLYGQKRFYKMVDGKPQLLFPKNQK